MDAFALTVDSGYETSSLMLAQTKFLTESQSQTGIALEKKSMQIVTGYNYSEGNWSYGHNKIVYESGAQFNGSWSSSDENVFVVTEQSKSSCYIEGIVPGKADLIYTDGDRVLKCEVTVIPYMTDLLPNPSKFSISPSDSVQINLTSSRYSQYTDKIKVSFSSNDESVATVDEKGMMKAVGLGETFLTGRVEGHPYTLGVQVIVKKAPESVKLITDDIVIHGTGAYSLRMEYNPDNDDINRCLQWTSTPKDALKFMDWTNGLTYVYGKELGEAEFIGKIADKIEVRGKAIVKGIKLTNAPNGKISLNIGESFIPDVVSYPADAIKGGVSLISPDSDIVKVENGKLVGVKPGITTVKVAVPYEDNPEKNYIEELDITVMTPPGEIMLTEKSLVLFATNNIRKNLTVIYPQDITMPTLSQRNWKSSNPDVVEISSLWDNVCELRGRKVGEAEIQFSDRELDAVCKIIVLDATPAPIATDPEGNLLESGSRLEKGTQVRLYAPEKGVAWYTLDESDPVSSDTRIQYSEPITVESDVIIKTYAEPYRNYASDGVKPSEVVKYAYTVSSISGVYDVLEKELKVIPTSVPGRFTVQGAADAVVRVFSSDGLLLKELSNVSDGDTVNLDKYNPGVYIVSVQDGSKVAALKLLNK